MTPSLPHHPLRPLSYFVFTYAFFADLGRKMSLDQQRGRTKRASRGQGMKKQRSRRLAGGAHAAQEAAGLREFEDRENFDDPAYNTA